MDCSVGLDVPVGLTVDEDVGTTVSPETEKGERIHFKGWG